MVILNKIKKINNISNEWGEYFDKIYLITIPGKNLDNIYNGLSFLPDYDVYVFRPAKKIINDGDNNITFFDILNHRKCNSTCENIMNNHLEIIREAYDEGLEKIVIMEDDIRFKTQDTGPMFEWLKNNNWDVFFFGYCQWPYLISYKINPNIVALTSPMGTFSYAISRSGMEKILAFSKLSLDNAKHIDKLIGNDIPINKYGVYPSICFQNEGPALFKKAIGKIPFKLDLNFVDLSNVLQDISLYTPILGFICIVTLLILGLYRIKP